MVQDETTGAVFEPFQEMWGRILAYLPNLAAGLLILLLGLVVCWVVKKALVRILLLMRLDRALRNLTWASALGQADVRHALANTIASVASGLLFLVFLDNAVIVWQLEVLARLIGGLVFYLPNLVVGALVLLGGSAIASAVAGRVRSGLTLEGFPRAGLAARLVQWSLMTIVVAFTLEELGVAPHLLKVAFQIGLGSLGLMAALAVGLGSRDAIAHVWRVLLERPPRDGGR